MHRMKDPSGSLIRPTSASTSAGRETGLAQVFGQMFDHQVVDVIVDNQDLSSLTERLPQYMLSRSMMCLAWSTTPTHKDRTVAWEKSCDRLHSDYICLSKHSFCYKLVVATGSWNGNS